MRDLVLSDIMSTIIRPARFLPRRARLAARDDRGARRARVADHGQDGGRSLRRRAGVAARGDRRTRHAAARAGARRSSAGGVRLRRVADPAARPLRHGLAGRPARAHAAHAIERPAARPGRVRHEGGIAIAMLATRALLETGARALAPHRHAVDDRRGDRQRDVARGDRGRGARAARRCWCSNRRCRAAPSKTSRKGCGELPARRCAASPRTPASSRRRARAPCRSWRTRFCAINALQDLARGISVNVVQVSRRHCGRTSSRTRRAPWSTCACRRRRPRREVEAAFRSLRAGRRADDASRRRGGVRPAAAGTQRPASRVCTMRLEMSLASSGRSSAKAAPAAARTGISPPRSGVPTLRWARRGRRRRARAARTRRHRRRCADRAALVAGLITRIK